MVDLERILSRPVAKPYRSGTVNPDEKPYLNEDGEIDFSPDDIENPKNWSSARRWYITIVAVSLVVNATFASSSPSAVLEGISEEFHVSQEASGLVITLFLLGYCAGPLFFAPLSEFYGRRWVFYSTFLGYIAFNFLCAFAPNFGSLLVGRFLTGTFASAALSNSPGVLADLWGPVERGNAMALFACMTFAGPALGPVVGGFLQLKKNWRWDFYVLLWLAGITAVFMFTIPETLPAQVLTNKAKRIRKLKIPGYENVKSPAETSDRTLTGIFKVALIRPWIILFDPISFLVAIYMSVVYCLLYMLFSIYPIVFKERRGWNAGVSELPLIGTTLGAYLGAIVVYINSRSVAKKMKAGIQPKPEDRLVLSMIAGVGFPITMFWFGWTAQFNSIHWIVPTLAGVFLAASIMLVFVSYLNYLTDTYLMYTASALAGNTVLRSAAGAAAPLFTNQMFKALDIGGGASLIGGVATLLAVIPFLFYKYGESIRIKSRFAPTPQADKGNHNDEEKQQENGLSEQASNSTDDSASTLTDDSDQRRSFADPEKAEGEVRREPLNDRRDTNMSGGAPEIQNAIGQPRDQNTMSGRQDVHGI